MTEIDIMHASHKAKTEVYLTVDLTVDLTST